jgi:sulfate adenylyltransferase
LSGSGKTTIADALHRELSALGRRVTMLDGDVVRTHLSKGLGFSRDDRDANVKRIGFVASEIVRHDGAVICAVISPYHDARSESRSLVGRERFVLAYVNTPLVVCEQRDVKGFYGKARRGEIHGFTGIDDPYETPQDADIVLSTTDCRPEDNARKLIAHLLERGLIDPND